MGLDCELGREGDVPAPPRPCGICFLESLDEREEDEERRRSSLASTSGCLESVLERTLLSILAVV